MTLTEPLEAPLPPVKRDRKREYTRRKVKPRKLVSICPSKCSFHPTVIGDEAAAQLQAFREAGSATTTWLEQAQQVLGHPVSRTAGIRHLTGHYRDAVEPRAEQLPGPKRGDLEILDLIIQRGAENSQNWKPSIKDTIEAMKLKMQMTGNSAFEDLISLFDGVIDEENADPEENPEALSDLAEPLL